ncbi:unnamed protein product, partial [marine sediment metagenome]
MELTASFSDGQWHVMAKKIAKGLWISADLADE